jgi:hypothetical protein
MVASLNRCYGVFARPADFKDIVAIVTGNSYPVPAGRQAHERCGIGALEEQRL